MPTAKKKSEPLTARQREGRVINAIAELLRSRLAVPNIYIEPKFPFRPADLLAVDRAGAGDLHIVIVKLAFPNPGTKTLARFGSKRAAKLAAGTFIQKNALNVLPTIPGHFKYLAVPRDRWYDAYLDPLPKLYSADGIGRTGIIAITERGEESPLVEVVVQPERFRVDPESLRLAEKKVIDKIRPDIEVRV